MTVFVGRNKEMADLNKILARHRNQFILVYGRRRVGKTTLLLEWAKQSGRKYIYWVATRSSANRNLQSLNREAYIWAHPDRPDAEPPAAESWETVFRSIAHLVGDEPAILILDEFSYAVEVDDSLPSYLQAAWDLFFKDSNICIVISGSHVGMMQDLNKYEAPLHGRFTAQLEIDPLPFGALEGFLPDYSVVERVKTYATVGGIPFYLEQFDPGVDLAANIRELFLSSRSLLHSEPSVLLRDMIRREAQNYVAVLEAVAAGKRTPQAVSQAINESTGFVGTYLQRLEEMHLLEKRLPATTPEERRKTSRMGQYYLVDSFLRFYFRFIQPNLSLVEQGLVNKLWKRHVQKHFADFVGATAFEDLCREWALVKAEDLPVWPDRVDPHWSSHPWEYVPVVAIEWEEKGILLGECAWTEVPLGEHAITEMERKAPRVVPGEDWTVHYAFFSRSGFSDEARARAEKMGALLVDMETLNEDLRRAMEAPEGF